MIYKHSLTTDVQPIPVNAAQPSPGDWSVWLRLIERQRRLLSRMWPAGWKIPIAFLVRMTVVSFRLDGVEVTEAQASEALHSQPVRRPVRSRLSQRFRSHLAILRHIQRLLSTGQALTVSAVMRWYASISCGLCTSSLTTATMDRLSAVVSHISSPRLRHQPAVQEVASLHAQLMADPLVPSFNGIMTRLLLCYPTYRNACSGRSSPLIVLHPLGLLAHFLDRPDVQERRFRVFAGADFVEAAERVGDLGVDCPSCR
jgi:hypothetical protein